MYERRFGNWVSWRNRHTLEQCDCPGVYAIARCPRDIANKPFKWRKDIIYIGMTNAVSGLSGRLRRFDDTISGKRRVHGGADRVRLRYKSYGRLSPLLYVAVARFKCNPASNSASDLRKMGAVAKFEYTCFAEYVEHFRKLPMFNDKATGKYSREIGPYDG